LNKTKTSIRANQEQLALREDEKSSIPQDEAAQEEKIISNLTNYPHQTPNNQTVNNQKIIAPFRPTLSALTKNRFTNRQTKPIRESTINHKKPTNEQAKLIIYQVKNHFCPFQIKYKSHLQANNSFAILFFKRTF
jgi:hypothetical protein